MLFFVSCCHVATAGTNLISNADFALMDGENPVGWVHGTRGVSGITPSSFGVETAPKREGRFLRITGGADRAGTWSCKVPGIEPYTDYAFSIEIVRKRAVNKMYPRVTVLGHSFFLDQVWFPKYDHRVRMTVNSGAISGEGLVVLENEFPIDFWFRKPCLEKIGETGGRKGDWRQETGDGREGRQETGDGKPEGLQPTTCESKPFFTAKGAKVREGKEKGEGRQETGDGKPEGLQPTTCESKPFFTAKGAKVREGKEKGEGRQETGDGRPEGLQPTTCESKPFFTAKGAKVREGKEKGEGRRETGDGRPEGLKPKTCDLKPSSPSFPLGLYGTSPADFTTIANSPFNLVRVGAKADVVQQAHGLGLDCFVRMPLDSDALQGVADTFRESGVGFGSNDYFYIDDEPELRSVDPEKLRSHKDLLRDLWPHTQGIMANVRPQCVTDYRECADVFMMDQYPIPTMPMTWLADSMDDALKRAGADKKIWAIVQAFGGAAMAKHGWPVFPSYEQIRCLTYLSLLHGARGILYYTYSQIKQKPTQWQDVQDIAWQIRSIESWLTKAKIHRLPVTMTSAFRSDALGRPAVQAGLIQEGDRTLLIAVNVTDRPVTGILRGVPSGLNAVQAPFDGSLTVVVDGTIKAVFEPWQVRVWVGGDTEGMLYKGFRPSPVSWMQTAMLTAPEQESGPWN